MRPRFSMNGFVQDGETACVANPEMPCTGAGQRRRGEGGPACIRADHRPAGRLERHRWQCSGHYRCIVRSGLRHLARHGGPAHVARMCRSGRFLRRRWQETAARVSDFLVGAFDAADPKMRGRNGTENIRASDILHKAARSTDEDLSAEPRLRARLRAVIGRACMSLMLTAKAEPLLRKAAAELQAPSVDQPDEATSALHGLSLLPSRTSRGTKPLHLRGNLLPLRRNPAASERCRVRVASSIWPSSRQASSTRPDRAGARAGPAPQADG